MAISASVAVSWPEAGLVYLLMLKRLLLRWSLLGWPLLAHSQAVAPLEPRRAQVLPPSSLRLPERLAQPQHRIYCPIFTITRQEEIFYGVPSLEPLLSRVVGTQVTPYSGAPGALQVVRLRGATGLAANPQPLYLLDDVPVFQNLGAAQLPSTGFGQSVGQFDLNPLLSLPVNDIESVTVMRGGLEAARYGAQGQYGVISIRTKAGKLMQPLRMRYDGYGGVQQARTRYSLLTASQFGALANEVATATGQPLPYSSSQLAALGQGTDWQQEVLRTATIQEHHLSLTAGRAATQYYVGADYLRQSGVLLNSWLQRLALRAQVTHYLTPRLTLTGALALSQLTARSGPESLALDMLTAPPTGAPYTADGQLTQPVIYQNNPVRQALEAARDPRQRQLLSRLEVRYPLAGPLRASLLGQWEQNNVLQTQRLPNYAAPTSRYTDARINNQFRQVTLLGALDFTHIIAERHVLTARLEASWQHYRVATETALLPSDQPGPSVRAYGLRQTLLSPAAQADYTYAKRYQVQGSFRLDRSTKLPATTTWQPAFGAKVAWHAEEENFLRDSPWLNTLGVWVSYGRTSNAGSFFDFSQLPRSTSSASGVPTIGVPVLEKATQLEAGLTTRFWQWLSMQTIVYQRQTAPDASLLPPHEPSLQYQVRARGLEINIDAYWHIRQTELSTTRLAFALQQNRFASALGYRFGDLGQYAQNDQPLSTFYGLRYLGVDAATGRPRYEDTNGDGTIGSSDKQNLGAGLPRCLLNLTQDLCYQRWNLQLQADALLGYTVYNYALEQLDNPTGLLNSSTRVLDRWTSTHRATDIPAAGQSVGFSSYQLQSGSHVRLTSISLSYKLRQKSAPELAVWAGVQNLFVLSSYRGYDPNVSSGGSSASLAGQDYGAVPVPRTWLAGVRLAL